MSVAGIRDHCLPTTSVDILISHPDVADNDEYFVFKLSFSYWRMHFAVVECVSHRYYSCG